MGNQASNSTGEGGGFQGGPFFSSSSGSGGGAAPRSGGGGGGGGGAHQNPNPNNPNPLQSHHQALRNLLRPTTGALGLTKQELDKRCKPSGLYPTCPWEDKAIRRLIADGKLAARLPGSEGGVASDNTIECPICFLNYPAVNATRCCQAFICTECYLQVRPQRAKQTYCPYCNTANFKVKVLHNIDEKIAEREKNDQLVIEAEIKRRNEERQQQPQEQSINNPHSFGASLQRTLSDASYSSANTGTESSNTFSNGAGGADVLGVKTMSPEERARLEEEMRNQNHHPLAQRLQQEEEERRLANDRQYYQSRQGQLREIRAARRELLRHAAAAASRGEDPTTNRDAAAAAARRPGGRDWNRIVDAFETTSGRSVQSIDDLVVLEAAIMLSMREEEEARRRRILDHGLGNVSSIDSDEEMVTFDSGGEAPRLRNVPSNNNSGDNSNLASSSNTDDSDEIDPSSVEGSDIAAQMQNFMRTLVSQSGSSASPRRNGPGNNPFSSGRSNTTSGIGRRQQQQQGYREARLDAASMLLRGISEEEQIAMAIAASLEEQRRANANTSENESDDANENGEGGESTAADSAAGSVTEVEVDASNVPAHASDTPNTDVAPASAENIDAVGDQDGDEPASKDAASSTLKHPPQAAFEGAAFAMKRKAEHDASQLKDPPPPSKSISLDEEAGADELQHDGPGPSSDLKAAPTTSATAENASQSSTGPPPPSTSLAKGAGTSALGASPELRAAAAGNTYVAEDNDGTEASC